MTAKQRKQYTEVQQVNSRQSSKTKFQAAALPALAFAAGVGVVLLSHTAQAKTGNPNVPEPSQPVDLQLYLGKWYEIARYENRFETSCEGVTAEYGLLPDGKISVRNTCHADSPAGRERVATAKARIVPNSGNAKLRVSFFGPFYVGNYWVLDHAEDYSWSIVGEPSGRYLWILARAAHPDEALRESLFERAAALGYDTSRLRPTQQ